MGTWENGVFDYDHIKKSYLPTYTRYWDDQSKVPFIYNPSTTIWISYDDKQSIEIKSDYIKREKLAGAMFWELSGDRDSELISVTFNNLNNDLKPSNESIYHEKRIDNNNLSNWEANKDYKIGEQVMYENKIYTCLLPHKSYPGWTPYTIGELWKPL